MTERLVDDPAAVSALARRTADLLSLPFAHVEKDFWVTEVLRGIAEAARGQQVRVIFKGGTSLSKAYGIIKRFSEDVDILVILPVGGSKGSRDATLKALVAAAEESTAIRATTEPWGTSRGLKRAARFLYPRGDAPTVGLSNGVLLELGSRGGPMPHEVLTVRSLVAEHAGADIAGMAEAGPFEVAVMGPRRTLIEKLMLLHAAHSRADQHEIVRTARHYYDVHRLLAEGSVIETLRRDEVVMLANDVFHYSNAADRPVVARPASGFASSPAFQPGPLLAPARNEYETRPRRARLSRWTPTNLRRMP